MSRGPRPHRVLAEVIPIAKARGIIQMALSGPERIFDIAIISKIPVTFTRVMFAPEILATIQQLADEFRERLPSSGSLPGTQPSRPSSGSGQSTGRGGSSWSHQTRWSRSTARGTGLCRDRDRRLGEPIWESFSEEWGIAP